MYIYIYMHKKLDKKEYQNYRTMQHLLVKTFFDISLLSCSQNILIEKDTVSKTSNRDKVK